MDAVDDTTFSTDVLQADKLVLVDFWAPWCGPCKAQAPVLERLEKLHADVHIVKLNIDESPKTAARYGVRSIPTLAVFNDGNVMLAKKGLQRLADLDKMLQIAKKMAKKKAASG